MEWFPLQLGLEENSYIDPINLPPLPPGKSAIDVSADYLRKLRQAIRSVLLKYLGETFNRAERDIRWWFTVPAVWGDSGKVSLRKAIIAAGYLRDENDDRLQFLSEPEATTLFCSKTGLLQLHSLDALLVVDAGKGTVDLTAYEVTEEQPFAVAELTAASGDSCG